MSIKISQLDLASAVTGSDFMVVVVTGSGSTLVTKKTTVQNILDLVPPAVVSVAGGNANAPPLLYPAGDYKWIQYNNSGNLAKSDSLIFYSGSAGNSELAVDGWINSYPKTNNGGFYYENLLGVYGGIDWGGMYWSSGTAGNNLSYFGIHPYYAIPGTHYAIYSTHEHNRSESEVYGVYSDIANKYTGSISALNGIYSFVKNSNNGNVGYIWSGDFRAANQSTTSGIVTEIVGVNSTAWNAGNANTDRAIALRATYSVAGTANVLTGSGLWINKATKSPVLAGTIINNYGIYIEEQNLGTNIYALLYNHPTSPFAIRGNGNVGIGKSSPYSKLDILGNTIISGNLNTTGSTVFGNSATTNHQFSGSVNISGTLTATAKSFDIQHPTKPGNRLRYGSLEGPENGVYVRGITTSNIIELPEYWTGLVDEDTITVNLTPYGSNQLLWIDKIENNIVYIGGQLIKCSYLVMAERKDVNKLVVEY